MRRSFTDHLAARAATIDVRTGHPVRDGQRMGAEEAKPP